jgi:di/tricarboxylate transporter
VRFDEGLTRSRWIIGGYRFADVARLGFPLVIVMVTASRVVIPIAWPLR